MSTSQPQKTRRGRRRAAIGFGIAAALILILAIGAYALFQHYYGLMNHTPAGNADVSGTDASPAETGSESESDPLYEDETLSPEETDSPEDEITRLEEELRSYLETNKTDLVYHDSVLNILLVGTDSRSAGSRGRSDSMILVSLNEETHQIILTSIMRDIYVQIEGWGNNRINAAYSFGGIDLLIPTIENHFGIRIDRYVQVNFDAFRSIVEQLGGVTVDISADEAEYLNNHGSGTFEVKDQTVRLNGSQALTYCRIRYLAGSDFGRTERQRKVLTAIFEEARSLNLLELNDLLNAVLPQVTTDLTQGETFSLLLKMPGYLSGYEIVSFRVPVDGSYENMTIDRKAVLGVDFAANREALIETIYGDILEDE